jgi:hypothetical protein
MQPISIFKIYRDRSDKRNAVYVGVLCLIIIACYLFLPNMFAKKQTGMSVYHYQAPMPDPVRDKFNKRIGAKQPYDVELAWVATDKDGKIYVERIK